MIPQGNNACFISIVAADPAGQRYQAVGAYEEAHVLVLPPALSRGEAAVRVPERARPASGDTALRAGFLSGLTADADFAPSPWTLQDPLVKALNQA